MRMKYIITTLAMAIMLSLGFVQSKKQTKSSIKMTKKTTIKIEIVSDIVCPWCYLGEKKLEKAMELANDKYNFEVYFKPFQLNPQMPKNGMNRMDYMAGKFGGVEKVKFMDQNMAQKAASEGLVYDGSKISISPNTFNAHRLIWLATKYNLQQKVSSELHISHFAKGLNTGDSNTLIEIGKKCGISEQILTSFFEGTEGTEEVKASEKYYREKGITSIPVFIINDEHIMEGALEPKAIVELFSKLIPQPLLKGESCNDESCDL